MSLMQDEKNLIPSFYSGFIKLFSGLAIVQILNFGFSLLLPRFYSPEDFAFFGIFTAIVFILLEIVTLKLDVTIFFPKEEDEALEIVHAIFLIAFFCAGITLIAGIFLSVFYHPAYLLLPVSLIVYGLVLPLNAWFNRQKDYRRLNTYRIIQAIAIPVSSLVFIIFFKWHLGLVYGFIFGQMMGLGYLLLSFKHFNFSLLKVMLVRKYINRYRHFPRFGVLSSLLNSLSQNSLVLFIQYFFGTAGAGHFTMASRILRAPAGMYQSAMSQVFLQQASHMTNAALNKYIKKLVWFGFLLGIVPALLIVFFGPEIFSFVFTDEWLIAGKMSQYLILWIFSTAIISPVALLLDIKQKLNFELGYNAFLLIFRIGALVAGVFFQDIYTALLLVCIVSVAMSIYLLYRVLSLTRDEA